MNEVPTRPGVLSLKFATSWLCESRRRPRQHIIGLPLDLSRSSLQGHGRQLGAHPGRSGNVGPFSEADIRLARAFDRHVPERSRLLAGMIKDDEAHEPSPRAASGL